MAFTPTGVEFFAKGLNKYLTGLGKADKAQRGLGDSASSIGKGFNNLGKSALGFGANLAKVATGGVALLGAGLVGLGVTSLKTAISFESAFAGVEKTVDGLDKVVTGTSQTLGDKLKGSLVEISKATPTTFEELAKIGELGGQLGIQYSETDDSLVKFTQTIADLGVATSLSEEEAATSLARISNIFQQTGDLAGENIERLGSTIVALGNNFATTEPEIVNFATRIAGAGQIAGLSQAEILAIGTAFSSVGVQAEAGGTAVQKVLLAMNGAVNATSDGFVDNSKQIDANVKRLTSLQAESARLEAQFPGLQDEIVAQRDAFIAAGGTAEEFGRQLGDKTRQKAFETAVAIGELNTETELLRSQQGQPIDPGQLSKFAQVAGLSADEFKAAWETDAAGAFQLFVEGLGKQGDGAEQTLRDLELSDQRLIRSFLSLAGAGDLLSETIELGNKAWEENTALSEEAAKRYQTTESQLKILRNTFRAIADSIGSRFLPIINRVITSAKDLIEKWAGPIEDAIENIVIPAIDNIINTVTDLITTFQAGGLFGSRSGSFGSEGLLAALGIPPDFVSIIENVFGTINEVIAGFQEGGVGGAFGALFSSESAGNALQSVIDFVTQFLSDNWPIIQAKLTEWGDMFFDWVNQTVVPAIPETLSAIVEAITTWASEQLPVIQETTQQWADGFWDWVQTVVDNAGATLAGIVASIGLWAASGETQSQLTEMGNSLGEALVTGIQTLLENQERLGEIINQVVGGLGIAALAAVGLLIAIGAQIVAGILQGILEELGINLEPTTLSELGVVLTGIGTNMLTAAAIIGTNIIAGISQGILDAIADLTTTLDQIGFIITQTVKDALGIASPSAVFFQFGVDIIQGLIDGVSSLLGSLGEIAGEILGAIFGGGGEEEAAPSFTFNPEEALVGLEQINALTEQINLALTNIFTVTLPTLVTSVATTVAAIIPLWQQVIMTIMELSMLIMELYSTHLPTLQLVSDATTQAMVTGFTLVNTTLTQSISLVVQLVAEIRRLGTETKRVVGDMVRAFNALARNIKTAAQSIKNDLVQALDSAARSADKLAAALARVNARGRNTASILAARGLGTSKGARASAGIGFQQGTLGFTVPPGFPNDTFPIRVTSGEEVLVAPPNSSIDQIVMDTFGFGGGSLVVEVNVGQINEPMDLAIVTEQIKRVVVEETS
jgi:hypothetical protein